MEMVTYCENDVDCRRKLTLSYFGEEFNAAECKETCDNCRHRGNVVVRDLTEAAKSIIKIVQEMKGLGIDPKPANVFNTFRGSKNKVNGGCVKMSMMWNYHQCCEPKRSCNMHVFLFMCAAGSETQTARNALVRLRQNF
jgi:superfamily II DNA helicase RecQ